MLESQCSGGIYDSPLGAASSLSLCGSLGSRKLNPVMLSYLYRCVPEVILGFRKTSLPSSLLSVLPRNRRQRGIIPVCEGSAQGEAAVLVGRDAGGF
jgi:hypothetical protein